MAQKHSNHRIQNSKKEKDVFKKPIVKLGIISFSLLQIISLAVFLILLSFLVVNNFTSNGKPEVEYYTFTKEGELIFADSLGNTKAKIEIEYAVDEYETQLGLMNRKEMKENQGMLFIFPDESLKSFWMRNTLISLDMIFVNSNKEIVTIHKSTKILSDQSYPSSKPAKYVVEVVAGYCDKHGIKEGDKISWMGTRMGL